MDIVVGSAVGGGGLRWEPTRASVALVDEQALREAGIDLPLDVARSVLCGLSRLVCAGEAEQRPGVYNALLLLRDVCGLPFERFGEVEEAKHPRLAGVSIPGGGTAMRQACCDAADLVSYWRQVRNRADDACLPLQVVLAFAPVKLWPLVATLIEWGPDRAAAHVEEALVSLAQRPISRSSRRRAEGALITPGTLKNRITSLWKLMECLIELRAAVAQTAAPALEASLLSAWTHKPGRPDVFAAGAVDAGIDTSGPPLDECARRLRQLEADFAKAKPDSRYIRERRLLLFALLVLYGIRRSALRRLRVEDYLPDHVLRDGVRGPVLRIFPRKTRRTGEEYLLPLPAELAAWLERWIASNGFAIGETDAPLFPSIRGDRKALSANGLGAAIAGKANGLGSGSLALLPHGEDPYHGWTAHQYRHTAYRLAQQAGAQAKNRDPILFAHVTVGDFATAVVAHTFANTVRNTYNDLDVHRLLRAAVTNGWTILRDEAGIRRGADPAGVRQARLHLEALQAEQAQIETDLAHLEGELDQLHLQAGTLDGDLLSRAEIATRAHEVKAGRLNRELARLAPEVGHARALLTETLEAQHPIPDEISEEEHAALVEQALGQQGNTGAAALSSTLTADDLSHVLEASTQAINRWHREGLPKERAGLWTEHAWQQTTRNQKRLQVDQLNLELLTDPQRRALIRVRRERAIVDNRATRNKQPSL